MSSQLVVLQTQAVVVQKLISNHYSVFPKLVRKVKLATEIENRAIQEQKKMNSTMQPEKFLLEIQKNWQFAIF